jgi:S-adenosylmethionine-diacylgycerolhomoserine-N-methlytransferase
MGSAAEKMDNIYRRQRFIYDATRRYYLLGRDRLIADLRVPGEATVLEVGCGTARNLVQAARRYPQAQLYGLDISEAMLRTARTSVARGGLASRITLAAGDATAFDTDALFGVPSFDRVFISYALSMIPAWPEVVKCAAAHVAPGGTLLIIDFGDFAQYPGLLQRAQGAWLRRFSVTPIPDFENRIKALASESGFDATTERLYGGYAIEVRLERRVKIDAARP